MVNAVGLAFVAMMVAVVSALSLRILLPFMNLLGIGNASLGDAGWYATGTTPLGIWGLLPILFPFIAIATIILAIYAFYRGYAGE